MVDTEQPAVTPGASASPLPADQPKAATKRYRRAELDEEEERRKNLLEQEEGYVRRHEEQQRALGCFRAGRCPAYLIVSTTCVTWKPFKFHA